MRVLVSILFSSIAVFAQSPQALVPSTQVPDDLSIPAQLTKTIDTNKCKVGDAVQMRTLEPVLISSGLVMPENAKLHGTILGAASRQNGQPSWVVLVIQRAEWADHTLTLRAFVHSQITFKSKQAVRNDSGSTGGAKLSPFGGMGLSDFQHGRYAPSTQAIPGNRSRSLGHAPRDATEDGGDATPDLSSRGIEDLYIQQARNGLIFLLSPKPHLKLPSGTIFMLHNRVVSATPPPSVPLTSSISTQ